MNIHIPHPKKGTNAENYRFLKWSIENGKAFWNKYIVKNSSKEIDCIHIDLQQKKLDGFVFNNTNFSNSNFSYTIFKECLFINSKFSETTLFKTNFQDTTFRNCDFSKFNFQNSSLKGAIFHNCKLDRTDFRNVEFLSTVEFKNSDRDSSYTCFEIVEEHQIQNLEPEKLIIDFDEEIIYKTHKEVVGELIEKAKLLKGHIYYKGVESPNGKISKSWSEVWENLIKSMMFLLNKQKGDALPEELLNSLDLEFKQIYHKEQQVLEIIIGYSKPESAVKQIIKISPSYSLIILSIISGIASIQNSYDEEIQKFFLERVAKINKGSREYLLISKLNKLQKGQSKTVPKFIQKAVERSDTPLPTYKKDW
jgi:hypothetical protein